MKKCTKCFLEKEEEEFNKDRNRPDGLYCFCRTCRKNFETRKYYDKHRNSLLEYGKKYRERNYEILLYKNIKARAIKKIFHLI